MMGVSLPTPPGDALFGCVCDGTIAWDPLVDALFASYKSARAAARVAFSI